jgi:2-dehydro-3-deoxyphosphooctonate aldolase (KDO 8-P synthase)
VQTPSGAGNSSGGEPQFIETLAAASVAAGVSGIFVEVHDDPAHALSDGANALALARLPAFWTRMQLLHKARHSEEYLNA